MIDEMIRKGISLLKYVFIVSFLFFVQENRAQTPEQLKSWLPDLTGWTTDSEIEIFNPDNLFDRINGAAPLFIENNFREMTSMEYKKGNDYITIQAYRHATPEDAFGMYSSERSTDLTFLPIGGEGQGDDKNLYFFSGCIYVKMWTNSSDHLAESIRMIGKTLANKIDPAAGYPLIMAFFPQEGKLPYSETYVTSSYIGHEFLKSVYVVKYQTASGQSFQLFLVDGKTKEGAREALNAYYTFTKQPLDFMEGEMTIKDRYNGDIPAYWKGQYIIGAFNENGEAVAGVADYIKELADKL
ncbi:MAG: hypothetical protein LBH58_05605 [Tannerellaceae bacterium]|jgi:hypothetical protein|nr:hypothetical protein [Tannerellaceae bacterium]